MNHQIKKNRNRESWIQLLRVSVISVFGLSSLRAQISQQQIALLTVGVLLLGFIVVFAIGKFKGGKENE